MTDNENADGYVCDDCWACYDIHGRPRVGSRRARRWNDVCCECGQDCSDEYEQEWTVNADHDIRVVSWHIADLLLGPDDGTIERNVIECQIQEVIKESFTETAGRDPVFGPVDPENPPAGYRPALPRRVVKP